MDRKFNRPLSVMEAKNHLRAAAREISPAVFFSERPYVLLAAAMCAGLLAGQGRTTRKLATGSMLAVLWTLNQSAREAVRLNRRTWQTDRYY
jgi:hypothetical protein